MGGYSTTGVYLSSSWFSSLPRSLALSVYLDVCPRLSASGQGASWSRRRQQQLLILYCGHDDLLRGHRRGLQRGLHTYTYARFQAHLINYILILSG